ncbi:hypothetical protein F5Y08DRAFT_343918 [Xylaria arbuscula]|nr:hypothetical protein F5Y08DRAFT_343918 [Xylaria arbuscula]
MSESEASSVLRIGFTRLSPNKSPKTGQPKVNIVFVHGLRGHPQTTWQTGANQKATETPRKRDHFTRIFRPQSNSMNPTTIHAKNVNNTVFWPRDCLVEDILDAEVWTYGYSADVIGDLFQSNNQNSISQHGRDLSLKMKPFIFVAHSLGGIVVKDAIRRKMNSEILDNIHDEFLKVVESGHIKVHSFFEARAITGIKGLDDKIVEDFSSKVGLSPKFESWESIDANHMEMARCTNKNDPKYIAIAGVIKHLIRSSMLSDHDARVQNGVSTSQVDSQTDSSQGETGVGRNTPCHKPHHYLPLSRNQRFTGRSTILDELKEKLFTQGESQKLAIVGLGGVGKTQVALQLAYWVKDNRPDYSVLWVSALGHSSFEQAYAEIARRFEIPIKPKDDAKEAVRRYFELDTVGKWLLIIDNADDMEVIFGPSDKPGGIYEYLPDSENGITVFTTRTREVAVAVAGSDMIELNEMNTEEAMEFFEKALFDKRLLRDKAAMETLLQELTFLPLAISQAAAYLNQTQTSIERYLKLLRNTEQDMVSLMTREFHDNTRYRGSKNAVASTWLVSFDQIRRSNRYAAQLLSFMSCIEWKAIPRSILPKLLGEEEMEHAIGVLCGYNFLGRREEEDIFDMHRLVHVAIRVWIQEEKIRYETDSRVISHLASIFPGASKTNRSLWREYMPHAQHALHASQECQVVERFKLLYRVGRCLDTDRRYKEAIVALEEAYQWNRLHYSEEDLNRLRIEHRLARAYLGDGRIKEATRMFEHIVAIKNKTLEEDNKARLAPQHELARAYLGDKRLDEAISLFEHVVAIKKKTLPEDDIGRLTSEHELARAYLEDKRLDEAISLFEHVVAIKEKTLPEGDVSQLLSRGELARAYTQSKQTTRAIALLEPVVVTRRRTLAEDDFYRLVDEHNLGHAYLEDGRINEAIGILEHVMAIKEKTQAADDEDLLRTQHILAYAYFQDNEIEKAISLGEHVVFIRKALDRRDKRRLDFERNLGFYYFQAGRNKEAIELLEHVVAIGKELSFKNGELLETQRLLAKTYFKDEQFGKAIVLYEHIIDIERELDTRGRSRLVSEYRLARVYLLVGRVEEAIVLLEHVVAVERELNMKDEDSLEPEKDLASFYIEAGRVKEAIVLREHVVAVEKELDMTNEERLVSQKLLASAYIEDGQFGKAITLREHVVAVQKELDMNEEIRLVNEHNLAYAYVKDKRIQEAIVLLEHVVAVEKELVMSDSERISSMTLLADAYTKTRLFGKAILLLRHAVAIERKLDSGDEVEAREILAKAYVKRRLCRNRAVRRTRCRSRSLWRKRSSRVF